jgi:hypothetical protein
LGGYIAPHLPQIFGYQLRTLFVVSGFMRGLVVFFFLRQVKEVRHVSEISSWELITGRPDNGEDEKPGGIFRFRKKESIADEDDD